MGHMGTLECLQFMTPSPPPKETNLIVPSRAPQTGLGSYRSIGSFFRDAPEEQKHNMLKKLGEQLLERMKAREDPTLPLWVSTAGYDVAWVHLRLDNVPKYYRFKEYKDAMATCPVSKTALEKAGDEPALKRARCCVFTDT